MAQRSWPLQIVKDKKRSADANQMPGLHTDNDFLYITSCNIDLFSTPDHLCHISPWRRYLILIFSLCYIKEFIIVLFFYYYLT